MSMKFLLILTIFIQTTIIQISPRKLEYKPISKKKNNRNKIFSTQKNNINNFQINQNKNQSNIYNINKNNQNNQKLRKLDDIPSQAGILTKNSDGQKYT